MRPAKRPAETPAEQLSPLFPKIARTLSHTASPAQEAAKKPIPQSSPIFLAPFALAGVAPPPSSLLPSPSHCQPTPGTTPQPQFQQSMQPPQSPQSPSSQSPSKGMWDLASADVGAMGTTLRDVESLIRNTQERIAEAVNAGNIEKANEETFILDGQIGTYTTGCEFVEKVLFAKRFVAGSLIPRRIPLQASNPTPVLSATSQATPPMNPHSQLGHACDTGEKEIKADSSRINVHSTLLN